MTTKVPINESTMPTTLPVFETDKPCSVVRSSVYCQPFIKRCRSVRVSYTLPYAQYHAALITVCTEKGKRRAIGWCDTAEHVLLAVIADHSIEWREIEAASVAKFDDGCLLYPNRQSAAGQLRIMNALYGFSQQYPDRVLALEMFGLNFFESDYKKFPPRDSCDYRCVRRECLEAILPGRADRIAYCETTVRRASVDRG